MKTFLKVLLIAALVLIALKLSPIIFVAALVGLIAAGLLCLVGFSLLTALLVVALAFTIALSPVWIPVMAVIGVVHLFRRNKPAAAPVAA